MLNETHHAPPRYKIPEFFSSLLEAVERRVEHVAVDGNRRCVGVFE
jgi:hypothetical protein